MWTIELPYKVMLGKREPKPFYLNLNVYRNAHYHSLNNAKIGFAEIVAPRIAHLPAMDRARISYHLYPGSLRECDVANICCIVDKFFSDVLVTEGKLPDDNYKHLLGTANGFGAVDKSNPRVEAYIEPM